MFLIRTVIFLAFFMFAGLAQAQVVAAGKNTDPFESINRSIFTFNNKLYEYALRPAVESYQFVMPDVAERGVNNFFANLSDVNGLINSILQGRIKKAAGNSGRFFVNTIFGIAGFVDVATAMGIERYQTDFGHTLALWGADPGPYLMLPLLGPRTARDGAGTFIDVYASPTNYIDDHSLRNALFFVSLLDGGAGLVQAEQILSGDRYLFVRDAYLQQREALVNDGAVADSFSNFEEQDDWDDEL